jgi:hypothetical protein
LKRYNINEELCSVLFVEQTSSLGDVFAEISALVSG